MLLLDHYATFKELFAGRRRFSQRQERMIPAGTRDVKASWIFVVRRSVCRVAVPRFLTGFLSSAVRHEGNNGSYATLARRVSTLEKILPDLRYPLVRRLSSRLRTL